MSDRYPTEGQLSDNHRVADHAVYIVDDRIERNEGACTVGDLRRDIISQGRSADVVCRFDINAREAAR